MTEFLQTAQPIGIIALVGICLNLTRMLNGRINGIAKDINNKVDVPDCHSAQDNIRENMNNRFDALDKRLNDIILFLKDNHK